ncbi:MAG: YqgE/AlgH family protein [Aeromicrobium sp.]|nr:YqgE/AlgH family protein [Burkholderiales bacterium]
MDCINLTNHFLIAMPGMADPHFSKTLTYICEHSEKGAIGLVINKPIDITVGHLFEQVNIALEDDAVRHDAVHFGGPVKIECGFVLHQPLGDWNSTLRIDDDIGMTTSKDILEAIARGEGPGRVLVTLGYAGWSPGQLEEEIKRNGWLTVEADAKLIFDLPAKDKLLAAMQKLGVHPAMLSGAVGHA